MPERHPAMLAVIADVALNVPLKINTPAKLRRSSSGIGTPKMPNICAKNSTNGPYFTSHSVKWPSTVQKSVGWVTGFEPATSGATVRRSTAELHPPRSIAERLDCRIAGNEG